MISPWSDMHARGVAPAHENLIRSPLGRSGAYMRGMGMSGTLRGVLAVAGAVTATALCAPGAAVAHPCASANAKAAAASSFLSINSAGWVGMRPVHVEHECDGEGGPVTSTKAKAAAAGPRSPPTRPSGQAPPRTTPP